MALRSAGPTHSRALDQRHHAPIAENALLRHQLIILERVAKRPRLSTFDRLLMSGFGRCTRTWSTALRIVQPETVLRWHRDAFRLLWRRRSRSKAMQPKIDSKTIALIRDMASNNSLWGAERIRGELIKLGIRVSKRTIQKYMRTARPRPQGQRWATFINNHRADLWACDFLQLYDLWFRPIFAFFVVELERRRFIHVAVTREPSSEWVAQQLRNATMERDGPRYLVRDRDAKFGAEFDRVAKLMGIDIVRTAPRSPNMNAHCERFLRSARRECLDHVLVLGERQLLRVLREYITYFNEQRPHQGIGQGVPTFAANGRPPGGTVTRTPVLGGLHHSYGRAA